VFLAAHVLAGLAFACLLSAGFGGSPRPGWAGGPGDVLVASGHPLAEQGNFGVADKPCALVVPAGAGLVAAAPPVRPVLFVARQVVDGFCPAEQASGLRDGQRDHPWVGGWRLIRPDRRWRLGAGAVAQLRGPGERANAQLKTWRILRKLLLPVEGRTTGKAILPLQEHERRG
jgi:hypothetical protein